MAVDPVNPVIHVLRQAMLREQPGCTDGALLGAFVRNGDAAAFDALVRRHAAMVWSVCRRVLHHHHDAEDAFQATFLVLAHKAASVRPAERVAAWLHGVAYRTALKLRTMTARRQAREKHMLQMPEPIAPARDSWHDVHALIDQELAGLPERYRLPIVLCDLEGKTIVEATEQLGWPQGTVAGRLARGRKLLARRLTNRGVSLTAGSLAAALAQQSASAEVLVSLTSAAVKAASLIAAGQATTAVSPTVAALTQRMLTTMLVQKFKMTMVVLSVIAVLGFGGGIAGYRSFATQPGATRPVEQGGAVAAPAPTTPRDNTVVPAAAPTAAQKSADGKSNEARKTPGVKLVQHKPFTDADLANLADPETIEVLRLRGHLGYGADTITDAGMASIVRFKYLRVLAAGGLGLTGRSLEPISRLDKLEELELDSNALTGENLDCLVRLKNLRKLNLNFNPLRPDTLAVLPKLRRLTHLSLYSTVRTADDTLLERCSKLTALERLHFPENSVGVTDRGLEHLARLENLQNLQLVRAKEVTDAGLARLAALAKLENLELREMSGVTPRGMEVLGKLTNLRRLVVDHTPMDDAALRALGSLKQLQHLLLWNIAFEPLNLDVLGALPALRSFRTNQTVSSSAIRALAKLDLLETITDELYEITDEDLAFLARSPKLRTLVLGSEHVTAAALPSLAKMKSLRDLYVTEKVRITPEQLTALGKTSLPQCRISRFRPPYTVFYQPPGDNTPHGSMRSIPAPR